MQDLSMNETSPDEMTPERARRIARALFVMTPFSFVLGWLLTAVQGADTRTCLIVSIAGTAMCLGAAPDLF